MLFIPLSGNLFSQKIYLLYGTLLLRIIFATRFADFDFFPRSSCCRYFYNVSCSCIQLHRFQMILNSLQISFASQILVDACKDVEVFKHDLFIFMKQRGTPIVYVPKVGYTRGVQNSLATTFLKC